VPGGGRSVGAKRGVVRGSRAGGFGRVPLPGSRLGQVDQVVVGVAEAVGEGEGRQPVFLLQRESDLVCDPERVLDHVGTVREGRRHLLRALEVQTVVVPEPVLVVVVPSGTDANQDVVCRVVPVPEEMGVVGGHGRQSQLAPERQDHLVDFGLTRRAVRLHLEVVAAGEGVGVPAGHLTRAFFVPGNQVARQFARHARRRHDDSPGVTSQRLPVHPRPIVEALSVPER